MKTLPAFLIMLLASSPALAECDVYQHESDDTVIITLKPAEVVVKDQWGQKQMLRVIEKPFGFLTDAAVENSSVDAPVHYFSFLKIDGAERLVFDAQVFVPACK